MPKFSKENLVKFYIKQKQSSIEIAEFFNCSAHKVNYWIKKYNIPKRSISEALYIKCNPHGDPFTFHPPTSLKKAMLYGLGLGLYWGEGNKKNLNSVRLGNTDPKLIKKFLEFLETVYFIDKRRLRFGLQIFNDMDSRRVLLFWQKELGISSSRFYKVTVTPTRGIGTYREKTKYGVLSIYFHNKKLRDVICSEIEKL